mmetsp:Transcript_9235/g.24265  ORF Transcript_9235/g.24265 Transcript_9235/m.24265 type:complete len:441 (-) Transcript_9235:183-1505(-)
MGSCVSQICGGADAKPKSVEAPQYAIAGYEWAMPEPAAPEPEPVPVSPPVPEEPAPPPKPAPTTPIVLETLQGSWVNSVGAKIKVEDTLVYLNGIPLKAHPLVLNEDGTVKSVGKIWQLKGWLEDEKIEFKEAPSMEVAEYARSVVWSKATDEYLEKWNKQMNGLGYGGSSKDPLKRGVEGCCPGTCDAKAQVLEESADRDKAELRLLNDLIAKYKLPGMRKVPPRFVIPDFSNRGHTGLSVEHVHYLAKSFKERGFIVRQGNTGHDIPVLVEEGTSSELGKKSIANWRSKLNDEAGFPPKAHYEKLFRGQELYTSLGNGHFNQALNLFLNKCPSIYGDFKYEVDGDTNLREAVEVGVNCVILDNSILLREREIISRLLNSKREYKWNVAPDGTLHILDAAEDTSQCKQFEAMSKVLDAVELNCLVRQELGVKDSHRIGQ